jgi:hypothetical protein
MLFWKPATSPAPPLPVPALPVPKPKRSRFGEIGTWRRKLAGSRRNKGINLAEVLNGIEDYFECFRALKKVDPFAYHYFSRVGLPITGEESIAIWAKELDNPEPLEKSAKFPMFFGSYNPTPDGKDKENWEKDGISLPEAFYFHRVKPGREALVLAGPGVVVYRVIECYLPRRWAPKGHVLTRSAANYWYLGVSPDGSIHALPFRWFRHCGAETFSGFGFPQYLSAPRLKNVPMVKAQLERGANLPLQDIYAHAYFSFARAMTIAALEGVQISIRRDGMTARVGVPLHLVPSFFRDRDFTVDSQGRREKIFHAVAAHDRHFADGRVIPVGEHFRGLRRFRWKDWEVAISVPGIHHHAAEGIDVDTFEIDDVDPVPPGMEDARVLSRFAGKLAWERGGNKGLMRKGQPTRRYLFNPLHEQVDRVADQRSLEE